jgi:hypothetical protein
VSQSEQHHSTLDDRSVGGPPKVRSRHLNRGERWGIAVAVVGVLVAVLAWWFPRPPDGPKPPVVSGTASAPPTGTGTATPGATGTGQPAAALTYLDSQAAQAGAANLTALPSDLRGTPGYDQPVAVSCPTNQNGDQVREVTYSLRGRYRAFSATVRPYFGKHPDSRAHVYAIGGFKDRDGTVTRREQGRQLGATAAVPAPLTATVERAETLTLQVQCEDPDGVVVLVLAGLSAQ